MIIETFSPVIVVVPMVVPAVYVVEVPIDESKLPRPSLSVHSTSTYLTKVLVVLLNGWKLNQIILFSSKGLKEYLKQLRFLNILVALLE